MTQQAESTSKSQAAQLIQDYHRAVYGFCYRLTGNANDAEDITQQTFLIAHQKADQIRDVEKAQGWLFAVARSCFLKTKRKATPQPAANLELDVDAIPAEAEESEVDSQLLQDALNALPDDQRLVVAMFYFEELSYKEISAALDVPIGTVMSRISRAKSRLRHKLLKTDPNLDTNSEGTSHPETNNEQRTDDSTHLHSHLLQNSLSSRLLDWIFSQNTNESSPKLKAKQPNNPQTETAKPARLRLTFST